MDERPMEAMREAIKVIKQADPEFKITLAGNYHPEIQSDLYYLSIPYGHKFPENVKAERERKGQISTVYTCCSEAFPNTFTFSDPAEATWTALHAIAGGYDGYLRWAVNSWTADPLRDSRFRTWAAGDTYSIYPGPRSSIRFERLVEGIQDCEKIRILREELAAKGAKGKLNKLNKAVAKFTPEGLSETQQSAAEMVNELNKLLNSTVSIRRLKNKKNHKKIPGECMTPGDSFYLYSIGTVSSAGLERCLDRQRSPVRIRHGSTLRHKAPTGAFLFTFPE